MLHTCPGRFPLSDCTNSMFALYLRTLELFKRSEPSTCTSPTHKTQRNHSHVDSNISRQIGECSIILLACCYYSRRIWVCWVGLRVYQQATSAPCHGLRYILMGGWVQIGNLLSYGFSFTFLLQWTVLGIQLTYSLESWCVWHLFPSPPLSGITLFPGPTLTDFLRPTNQIWATLVL